jgi:predicted porin
LVHGTDLEAKALRVSGSTAGWAFGCPAGIALSVAIAIAVVLAPGAASAANLVGGSYQLTWDQSTDRTDLGETTTRSLKQTLDLKYRGLLTGVIENELTLKVEQEIKNDGTNTVRVNPAINLAFKGGYWSAGAKRTIDDSNEPGKNPKISDSYIVEFYFRPSRPALPDLKGKYSLDTDFEQNTTDTRKQAVTLSTVYQPVDSVSLKGEYDKTTSDDRLQADADTEEEKLSFTAGVRREFTGKLKASSEYKVDITHGATLKSNGTGATPGSAKQDEDHTWKNTLAFRPFRDTDLDASYDFDLKENLVTGEHTITQSGKGAVSQQIGEPFSVKADASRVVTEALHTADDNRKTEDTYTADFRAKFGPKLDFTLKYQKKDTVEDHVDNTKDTTSGTVNKDATWNGELTPFWKANASYDLIDTITLNVKTTVDTKYSLKSTFDFKRVNLLLEPTYDITMKDDLLKAENTATRDFKFKLAYTVFTTMNAEGKFDHTYGRKTDSALQNVQRTDATNANVVWKEPFPGWSFGFDVTRSATDTSEDDLPPDITSSYGIKADYRFDMFSLAWNYKYDKKSVGDNSENFDIKGGWIAPQWDVSLSYTFKKTFSLLLNEGYSINFTFKYNL